MSASGLQINCKFCSRNISSVLALTTPLTTPSAVGSPAVLSGTSTAWCRWTSRWPWWSASPSSSSVWPRLWAWWCVVSSTAVLCTTPAVGPTRGQTTFLTALTTMGQIRWVSRMEIRIFSFFSSGSPARKWQCENQQKVLQNNQGQEDWCWLCATCLGKVSGIESRAQLKSDPTELRNW